MKELIQASKTALQGTIPYVKDRDIYVTEDTRLIRNSGGYPAIGIKDGSTNFETLTSDQDETTLSITFVAYVQLVKPEAGVMGKGNRKGVLEVAKDIIATLKNNDLGLVETATPATQGQSEILTDGKLAIIMVPVTMEYTRYDTN